MFTSTSFSADSSRFLHKRKNPRSLRRQRDRGSCHHKRNSIPRFSHSRKNRSSCRRIRRNALRRLQHRTDWTLSRSAGKTNDMLAHPLVREARRYVISNANDRWNAAAQNSPAGVRYAQIRPVWYFRLRVSHLAFAAYSDVLSARSDSFRQAEHLRRPASKSWFILRISKSSIWMIIRIIAMNHDAGLNNSLKNG